MMSAEDWISALPHELAAQRALLHRLLAAVRVDQQWDWLVQDAAGHADPRTTRGYDHSRHNLDRHPTYLLTAHLRRATPRQRPEQHSQQVRYLSC